jgi:hypothetical protein
VPTCTTRSGKCWAPLRPAATRTSSLQCPTGAVRTPKGVRGRCIEFGGGGPKGGAAAPRPSTRTKCAGHRDVGQPRAMRASSGPPGLQQGGFMWPVNPRNARTLLVSGQSWERGLPKKTVMAWKPGPEKRRSPIARKQAAPRPAGKCWVKQFLSAGSAE